MLRCFRKLAKPLASISLIGFVGQFLFIYCISMANATTNASLDVSAAPMMMHHHGAVQHTTQGNDGTATPADKEPCCCKHDSTVQEKESCCSVNTDQPFLSEVSRNSIKEDHVQHADFVAILIDPIPALDRTPIRDISLKPGFERPRFSTPTYLANCSFLE
jgi:hypothetical protein